MHPVYYYSVINFMEKSLELNIYNSNSYFKNVIIYKNCRKVIFIIINTV